MMEEAPLKRLLKQTNEGGGEKMGEEGGEREQEEVCGQKGEVGWQKGE